MVESKDNKITSSHGHTKLQLFVQQLLMRKTDFYKKRSTSKDIEKEPQEDKQEVRSCQDPYPLRK